ncbi:hypothetical protein StrepF001_40850 [Streptomyces sp. F001]|uniref:hypothetical protein n=1 Tax=Streptomyces sp. F001 TaxID=1510026 RepID=UPI00101E59C9|nr:hypothetical protein [Streptomyces sp. F001]RZB13996.1 hypothetical protein StrepF001_40850 [Streptomyces sp. F001]
MSGRIEVMVCRERLRVVAKQATDLGEGLVCAGGQWCQVLRSGQKAHGFLGAGRHSSGGRMSRGSQSALRRAESAGLTGLATSRPVHVGHRNVAAFGHHIETGIKLLKCSACCGDLRTQGGGSTDDLLRRVEGPHVVQAGENAFGGPGDGQGDDGMGILDSVPFGDRTYSAAHFSEPYVVLLVLEASPQHVPG